MNLGFGRILLVYGTKDFWEFVRLLKSLESLKIKQICNHNFDAASFSQWKSLKTLGTRGSGFDSNLLKSGFMIQDSNQTFDVRICDHKSNQIKYKHSPNNLR